MNLDPKKLAKTLVEKWEYLPKQVGGTVEKILKMDPEILAAFKAWDGTSPLPESPNVLGYTPRNLGETFDFKPPACFLFLDWVRREPCNAMTALLREYGKIALSIRILPEKSS